MDIIPLGPDATLYNVGDEVLRLVGGGAYAEYVASCAERLVIPKPTHRSWAEAASIPENFLTGAYPARVPVH